MHPPVSETLLSSPSSSTPHVKLHANNIKHKQRKSEEKKDGDERRCSVHNRKEDGVNASEGSALEHRVEQTEET
jgi:hypothetical protein